MNHPPIEILIQHSMGMANGAMEVEHIAGCRECAAEMERLSEATWTDREAKVPERLEAFSGAIERERESAGSRIESVSDEDLLGELESNPVFRTVGGLQVALEYVPFVRRRDPSLALVVVRALIDIVEEIDAGTLKNDLRADVLREAGSCARATGSFNVARHLLEDAASLTAELPAGDFLLARIWYERARLEIDAEGKDAGRWASRAAEMFHRFGDLRLFNRSRYVAAIAQYHDRRYRDVIDDLLELVPSLESDRDPVTLAMAWATLGQCFTKQDRIEDAKNAFAKALELYRHDVDLPIERLRAEWSRARMILKQGDAETALAILESVQDQFEGLSMTNDVGLVELDITEALLLQGEVERAREVCRQSMEKLHELFSGREQQRALAYLSEITSAGTTSSSINAEDVRKVASYLHDSLEQPDLIFCGQAGS